MEAQKLLKGIGLHSLRLVTENRQTQVWLVTHRNEDVYAKTIKPNLSPEEIKDQRWVLAAQTAFYKRVNAEPRFHGYICCPDVLASYKSYLVTRPLGVPFYPGVTELTHVALIDQTL